MVVGIRRCGAFLSALGLPQDISRNPVPMRHIARDYYEAGRSLEGRSATLDAFAVARGYTEREIEEPATSDTGHVPLRAGFMDMVKEWSALSTEWIIRANAPRVQAVFDQVAAKYGHDAALGFLDWGTRHFTNRRERIRWRNWSRLLPVMAGIYRPRRTDGIPPLSPGVLDGFVRATREHFGPAIAEQDEKMIAEASRTPLSRLEWRWVTGGTDEQTDEDTARGDEFDLLTVRRELPVERAVRVLGDRHGWMGEADWELLLQWARKEAENYKMALDLG